jgi:hypothetical protein
MGAYLSNIGNPAQPPRQGYVIGFYQESGYHRIIIAGSDLDGARYGCVTLSMMIKNGPEIVPATVEDWPDFKYRVGFEAQDSLESNKDVIDQAFRAKINSVMGPATAFGAYTSYNQLLAEAPKWKATNDYAFARGVHIMYIGWWDVGYNGLSTGFHYPYKPENGTMGHRGWTFTWSNDALLNQAAQLYADFMQATGADMFFLHSQDIGSYVNPENWNYRTQMDRDRFGNDRAAADANVINIFLNKMRAVNPNVIFYTVVYPYGADYLQYQHIANWMADLTTLVPNDIYFCLRESDKEGYDTWRDSTLQGRGLNYYGAPWFTRYIFSPLGRYVRTFYNADDRDILWYTTMIFSSTNPNWADHWSGAEYMWNTEAPGWGWYPGGRIDTGYNMFDQAEQRGYMTDADIDKRFVEFHDGSPIEITDQLAPRIGKILFGEEAGVPMAKALAKNLSAWIPSYIPPNETVYFLSRDFEAYYTKKAQDAVDAWNSVQAAAGMQIPASKQWYFGLVKDFFDEISYLYQARGHYYTAKRELEVNNNIALAYEEIHTAVSLADQVTKTDKVTYLIPHLKNDINNLYIQVSRAWDRAKDNFAGKFGNGEMSVGIYSSDGLLLDGLLDAFSNIRLSHGIIVSTFDAPTKETLSNYDVIIFSGSEDMVDMNEDWRSNVDEFVMNGGGVIFSHNAVGKDPASDFGQILFPDIIADYGGVVSSDPLLTVSQAHPSLGDFDAGKTYNHLYQEHLYVTPGTNGTVILRDSSGNAVMVVGQVGAGRVIYTGELFSYERGGKAYQPVDDEWKALFHMVNWAGDRTGGSVLNGRGPEVFGMSKALYFNGVDTLVDFGNNASLHTDSFTIELWINTPYWSGTEDATNCLSSKYDNAKGWLLGKPTPGDTRGLRFFIFNDLFSPADQGVYEVGDIESLKGTWIHLSGVYSAGEYLKVYVNGLEVASITQDIYGRGIFDNMGNVSIPLLIGKCGTWAGLYEGAIDDVRFYNRALSYEEVKDNYMDSITQDGLVSWWKFEGDANDSIGNNHGSIIGYEKWVPGRNYGSITVIPDPADPDGDGWSPPQDCDDTDPTINPGATEVCDGVDNNCDTNIDEGFNVGNICYSLTNSCGDYNTGSFVCTVNGISTECSAVQPDERSGYGDSCMSAPNNCGDTNTGVYVCADVGVKCNAVTPDDRPLVTAYIDADNDGYGDINSPVDATCGMPSGATDNSLDCNDNDPIIYPDATEIKHDGIDQDCNGYDLTIEITKAMYINRKDNLRVNATSSLGKSANLNLEGYGAMEAKKRRRNQIKWVITVRHAGGDPGTVTVCGIEGCESTNTTVK